LGDVRAAYRPDFPDPAGGALAVAETTVDAPLPMRMEQIRSWGAEVMEECETKYDEAKITEGMLSGQSKSQSALQK